MTTATWFLMAASVQQLSSILPTRKARVLAVHFRLGAAGDATTEVGAAFPLAARLKVVEIGQHTSSAVVSTAMVVIISWFALALPRLPPPQV